MLKAPTYLDCNATTPLDSEVRNKMMHYIDIEFGNAASRTHVWGAHAKQAVQYARNQVAQVVKAKEDEVIFTSGATESNNIGILGLAAHGEKIGKNHIISTTIEHKAVLEPLEFLEKKGFEITLVSPDERGRIDVEAIQAALRKDTLLVSVMQANNETGILQPITEISELLLDHDAFFHVDAAQGFGKEIPALQSQRIDLISISAHKVFGPKGVGGLVVRRRGFKRLPLEPLMYGGGHERGLRPGTLPVHLIAGFGEAAELAVQDYDARQQACNDYRQKVLDAFSALNIVVNGDQNFCLPHVLNLSIEGLNSEAAIVALKDLVAISNGSACTSQSYEPSHVLVSMGLSDERVKSSLRISWCHMTEDVDWEELVARIERII